MINNPSVTLGFKFQVLHTAEGFLSIVTFNAFTTYDAPRSAFKGDSA